MIDWGALWIEALAGGALAAGVFALMLLTTWVIFKD